MDIVIYQDFLNAIAQAVQEARPELLAAHTEGYDKLPFPYIENKPLKQISLKILKDEVDYDVRGSALGFEIKPTGLEMKINLDASSRRTSKNSISEARFQTGFFLRAFFDDPNKTVYPLVIAEAKVNDLQPLGLGTLVSWLFAESLSNGTQDKGVPLTIEIVKGKITVTLNPPELLEGKIHLNAKIK